MKNLEELFAGTPGLERGDLDVWIKEELVTVTREQETLLFTDEQCARVRLICTLRYELEIDAAALPLVMSLIDQLYDTRKRLLSLSAAVVSQDRGIQSAIIAAMESRSAPPK